MNNKIPCGGFYLDDTLGVDENGKLGVNRFIVTFTMNDDGNISPDKTFSEIFDAYKAGRNVSGVVLFAPNDWSELYVSTVNSDDIDFFAIFNDPSGCMYAVVNVSRTGGSSLYRGLLTQAQ